MKRCIPCSSVSETPINPRCSQVEVSSMKKVEGSFAKAEKHPKNYHSMYHFLEGLLSYDTWGSRISWKTKNRALIHKKTRWDTDLLEDNFDTLFCRFRKSIIVVSYGAPGYPSIYTIRKILKQYKSNARVIRRPYNYKLSNKNGGLFEVLLIGQ